MNGIDVAGLTNMMLQYFGSDLDSQHDFRAQFLRTVLAEDKLKAHCKPIDTKESYHNKQEVPYVGTPDDGVADCIAARFLACFAPFVDFTVQ